MDDRPLLDPSVPAVPPVDSAGKEGTAPPMKTVANEEATGTAPPMESAAAEMAPGTALSLESADKDKAHGAETMNRIRGFFFSSAGRSSPPQGRDSSSTTGGSSTGTNDCVIHIWSRGGAGKKGYAYATINNGEGGATSKTGEDLIIKNGEDAEAPLPAGAPSKSCGGFCTVRLEARGVRSSPRASRPIFRIREAGLQLRRPSGAYDRSGSVVGQLCQLEIKGVSGERGEGSSCCVVLGCHSRQVAG
ncbi:hypothetical protein BRADI_2g57603v3 [Brachypodium distachyon]|uniref:Uncharacterized protein n=1 Tax=Brachypodium distachyon TaxID=15368 RepID=A0A2K2DGG7_BRADI|nr:hypothetical protein BRADI_2g57603v3 [Brachypodium distachyon]